MSQEQSSNTPDYWADLLTEGTGGMLWSILPDGLPQARKEALKQSIRNWVIDIREDEIQAISREIEKQSANSSQPFTARQTIELLHQRLPKRIGQQNRGN